MFLFGGGCKLKVLRKNYLKIVFIFIKIDSES